MPNQQIALTQTAIGKIEGRDANGNVAPIQGVTLSIDRYDVAYVAPYQGEGGPHGYMVVPKNPSQIGTVTVTITANGSDANGNSLGIYIHDYIACWHLTPIFLLSSHGIFLPISARHTRVEDEQLHCV